MQLHFRILGSVNGLFKLAELVLVLVILLILRFSDNGVYLGGPDVTLMGLGTVVGFLIIISAVLVSYVTTGAVSSLEFLFNIAAVALFLATGILILQQSRDISVGVLSIVTGVVFLVEILFLNRARIHG